MQDLSTGEMREIDPRFFEGIEKRDNPAFFDEKLQAAKDAAIPVRENQGPVFAIGEELEIRGGRFRVHAISDKRIYLDSIPSK